MFSFISPGSCGVLDKSQQNKICPGVALNAIVSSACLGDAGTNK
jgi:hypothetical protein